MDDHVRRCRGCDGILSRYNQDVLCLACARAAPPTEIPPGLWQLAPIRSALRTENISAVLIGCRQALGLSQMELAHLLSDETLNFSQPKISRFEVGAPMHDINDRRRLSDVLGIPAELLGLASRTSLASASLALQPAIKVAGGGPGQDMERRTLLTGAAALVGWTLTGPLAKATYGRIGTAHVNQAEDALTQLWALDDRYGGDGIHELAAGLFHRVQDILKHGTYDQTTGRQLQVLAGRLAEHAGWLSFDAGRQDYARYFLIEALTAARLTADEELEVLVLGSLSVQAAGVGRFHEAIACASHAQDSKIARRTPAVYAMAASREARAHALSHDQAAASKALLRADRAFDRAASRPEWVAYLDEAELTAKSAFCWAALGHADKATKGFGEALAGQRDGYHRNRALYSGYLARAHFANQEVEQAATVGLTTLDHAEKVTSARVLDQIAVLRRQLETHRSMPVAHDYIEQFDTRFASR